MREILMSIRPQWCEKIFNGSKTIEVRKSRPSIPTPFKVYVYETKGKTKYWSQPMPIPYTEGRGKVIGSFVCDKVYKIVPDGEYYSNGYDIDDDMLSETCLGRGYLTGYGLGYTLYGWHITEPKLFDEPKEFYELYAPCKKNKQTADESCKGCAYAYKGVTTGKIYCDNALTRPPQSWCYVEDK